jgi:hypothetical protein
MFVALLIGSIVLQAWAWRSLAGRLRGGALTRLQTAARYAGWAFLPVLLFVAVFMAMVGLEEWLKVALIEERAALLALPVVALSVLGTIGFTVRCAFVRRAQPRTHQNQAGRQVEM